MMKPFWSILEWPLGLLLWAWTRLTLASVRVRGAEAVNERATIYVHWHRYLPVLMPLCGAKRHWIMMSAAPRMAPIARWAQLVGLRLVRGASGEGGRAARDELARKLRGGDSVVLAVDGPAGPVFRARPGCAELSLATGAPIRVLAYRARPGFTTPLRWDRQLLTLPFASVEVVSRVVTPVEGEGLDALLARVQAALEALG